MLSAHTKKTASVLSVVPRPGPLPGTEPGAGSLKMRLNWGNVGALWGVMKLVLFGAVVVAALTGFFDDAPNTLRLGDAVFSVKVADTEEERTTGLSDTTYLAPNEGMLFVFDHEGLVPIWMKDMDFAIDIIWLDKDKKVINIDHNVAPDTYPSVFMSYGPALYALEIPGGEANNFNIKPGQTASFNLEP